MTEESRRGDAADQADAREDEARKDEAQEQIGDRPEEPHEAQAQDADTAPQDQTPQDKDPQDHEHEKSGSSVAGTLLTWLVLVLVGAGLAAWGLPKIAPHLPASVAQYVAPAGMQPSAAYQAALDARFADLESRLAEARDAAQASSAQATQDLQSAIETATSRAAAAAQDAVAQAENAAAQAEAAIAAARDAAAQAAQALETAAADPVDQAARNAVSGLDQRLSALSEALRQGGNGETDQAIAARVAEAENALSTLRQQVSTLGQGRDGGPIAAQIAQLAAQVAAVANRPAVSPEHLDLLRGRVSELAARLDDESAARGALAGSVDQARNSARAGAALAELERAATQGRPFAEMLAELASLGIEAPEPVAASAKNGAPAYDDLIARFPAAARAALDAASASAGESGDLLSGVLSSLEARVTGLPVKAQEGNGPAAILSRARAAIANRDAAAALSQLDALPQAARQAMSGWIGDASARAALDAGLAEWRKTVRAAL